MIIIMITTVTSVELLYQQIILESEIKKKKKLRFKIYKTFNLTKKTVYQQPPTSSLVL